MICQPRRGCFFAGWTQWPTRWLPALVLLGLTFSCASSESDQDDFPEHGWGLLSVDAEPPAGVDVYAAPILGDGRHLAVGNQLIYRRRGDRLAHFRIETATAPTPEPALAETPTPAETSTLADSPTDSVPGWKLIDVETGVALRYDPQWLDLGKDLPNDQGPLLILDPGDPFLHFPLWVGKSWSAHFLSLAGRRKPLAVEAHYQCDGAEWVTTPAGRFYCLRIWRQAQLAAPFDSYAAAATKPELSSADLVSTKGMQNGLDDSAPRQRTSLYWYAPELGFVVKRLDDSELLELIEIRR